MSDSRNWTRCILLMPSGFAHESEVMDHIAARDWIAVPQHDPWLTMAELCIRQRSIRSRSNWGLPSGEHLALVIVEPSTWPLHEQFLEAIRSYASDVAIWSYSDRELQAIVEQDIVDSREELMEAEASLPSHGTPTINSTPTLHMASIESTEPEIEIPDQAESDQESMKNDQLEDTTRITPEEIDMLLAAPSGGTGGEHEA